MAVELAVSSSSHFHLFTVLPLELRLKIWKISMSQHVLVHLWAGKNFMTTPRSVAGFACHEAWELAKKTHRWIDFTDTGSSTFEPKSKCKIWLNLKNTTFYLGLATWNITYVDRLITEEVRNHAEIIAFGWVTIRQFLHICEYLPKLKVLRKLIILVPLHSHNACGPQLVLNMPDLLELELSFSRKDPIQRLSILDVEGIQTAAVAALANTFTKEGRKCPIMEIIQSSFA
ncbi:hypothetical protein BGZ60DRAFT_432860 [Tricladium varicosporioides]|nr:hypothetical protein BGZ60DRAFT_432860 [Hymenoscyphus varicosporioides]